MQNQPVMRILAVFLRHLLEQFFLHGEYVFSRGQSRAIGHTEDMCIHGDRRMTEGGIENHVGGFASNTRQGLQCFARGWHLSAMFFNEELASLQNMGGFGVIETDGLDVTLEASCAEGDYLSWCTCDFEKFRCGLVDTFVRRLGGEDHRHQQLKGCAVLKLSGRLRIRAFEPLEDRAALLCVH